MMHETTAIGILREFPSTQDEINKFSDLVIREIKKGDANPLQMHIQLKAFAKASERILKETNENTLREAGMYPERNFEAYGASIAKAPTSTKYVYYDCNDPELNYLQIQFDKAEAALKARQEFLKNLTGPLIIITEDGEKAEIKPALKVQTDGLKVSFK